MMNIFRKKKTQQIKDDNYYYRVHMSSSLGSSWHIFRHSNDISDFFESCRSSKYIATKFTVEIMSNWSDIEVKELNRLKDTYEPNTTRS